MSEIKSSKSSDLHQVAHILVCDAQSLPTMQEKRQELLSSGQRNIDMYCLSTGENETDLWPVFERVSAATVFVCGNTDVIQMVQDWTGHWPAEQLNFIDTQVRVDPKPVNVAFQVILANSGSQVHVDAEMSLLEALRFEGVEMVSSCESGTCGTCKTRLISGIADHRDHVLCLDERDRFIMPCVSRAQADQVLVLEL